MSLAAGSLNVFGRIEKRAGKDALNRPLPGWVLHLERWMNVGGSTGLGAIRESQGAIPDGSMIYSIRIRYAPNAGITEGMRVNVADSYFFDINKIRHDFAGKEWTDLICTYGASDG